MRGTRKSEKGRGRKPSQCTHSYFKYERQPSALLRCHRPHAGSNSACRAHESSKMTHSSHNTQSDAHTDT